MFEVPDAKRVKRSELYGDSSDDEEIASGAEDDGVSQAALNAKLAQLLDLEFSVPEGQDSTQASGQDEHQTMVQVDQVSTEEEEVRGKREQEFEFRLFSTSEPSAAKVVLSDDEDDEATGEGGFVVPHRPLSYYFAEEPSSDLREQYRLAAVTAEEIIRRSKSRAWGLEQPWRVKKITVSASTMRSLSTAPGHDVHLSKSTGDDEEDQEQSRKRPGKKRRIALRKKETAKKEEREAAQKREQDKEEHLKEKKKRLNREKKLKRRQKEKEKKLATAAEGGDADRTELAEGADSASGAE